MTSKFDGYVSQPVFNCLEAMKKAAAAQTPTKGDANEFRLVLLNSCALMLRLALDDDPESAVEIINHAFATAGWRLVTEH
jgi:hypothetical protein